MTGPMRAMLLWRALALTVLPLVGLTVAVAAATWLGPTAMAGAAGVVLGATALAPTGWRRAGDAAGRHAAALAAAGHAHRSRPVPIRPAGHADGEAGAADGRIGGRSMMQAARLAAHFLRYRFRAVHPFEVQAVLLNACNLKCEYLPLSRHAHGAADHRSMGGHARPPGPGRHAADQVPGR